MIVTARKPAPRNAHPTGPKPVPVSVIVTAYSPDEIKKLRSMQAWLKAPTTPEAEAAAAAFLARMVKPTGDDNV